MKKQWITPSINVEEFAANDYVSVCMSIACVAEDEGLFGAIDHTRCKNINNQVVRGDDSTGYYVVEIRGGADVDPQGTFDRPSNNNSNATLSSITAGQTVYWNNRYRFAGLGPKVTWHHHGVVQSQDPNRPNHS